MGHIHDNSVTMPPTGTAPLPPYLMIAKPPTLPRTSNVAIEQTNVEANAGATPQRETAASYRCGDCGGQCQSKRNPNLPRLGPSIVEQHMHGQS